MRNKKFKTLINQGGLIECPYCKYRFKWRLLFGYYLKNKDTRRRGIPNLLSVKFRFRDNKNIDVIVDCEHCHAPIKIKDIPPIKKNI